jgi:predicted acetyltransferase
MWHTLNLQKEPTLEVIPAAPAEAPIIANLLELYAHDFSKFHNVEIGEDGRFGYSPLPLYWSEPDRHPFFIKLDGKLAGLVLVTRQEAVWDMAEFFVLRGCRRRGIGTQAAHEVWRRFPGPWQVRVMQKNTSAQHFWSTAISKFAPIHIEKHNEGWTIFSFDSK